MRQTTMLIGEPQNGWRSGAWYTTPTMRSKENYKLLTELAALPTL